MLEDDVISFVKEQSDHNSFITIDTCLSRDLDILMDDFHECIREYAKVFDVDMSDYLWYFHASEEGFNIGRALFKAPYDHVDRIEVTPRMLAEFARSGKWDIDYPGHTIPKYRYDLWVNFIPAVVIVFAVLILTLYKIFYE